MSKLAITFFWLLLFANSPVIAELRYPYYANEERASLIINQYTKIEIGSTAKEVLSVLPQPDEIRDLYEPKMYKPDIIGSTYWYIIQRKAESGSVIEKDEKLVRVSFDLKGRVTKVDKWGF